MERWCFEALPNEIIERIFSYVIAQTLVEKWKFVSKDIDVLSYFEHKDGKCGVRCSDKYSVFKQLELNKRCRAILKGMCVFKPCVKGERTRDGNILMEYDFRPGILHKK
jgi:hypothetical protein